MEKTLTKKELVKSLWASLESVQKTIKELYDNPVSGFGDNLWNMLSSFKEQLYTLRGFHIGKTYKHTGFVDKYTIYRLESFVLTPTDVRAKIKVLTCSDDRCFWSNTKEIMVVPIGTLSGTEIDWSKEDPLLFVSNKFNSKEVLDMLKNKPTIDEDLKGQS